MNFKYSFNLKEDLPHIQHLPDTVQCRIEGYIVSVIYESFMIPGDQDYLTARLLAKKGLYRAFFWAAAQCIEKYLKAFLLLNGFSDVKKKKIIGGHSISALIDAAIKIDAGLKKIDLAPHPTIDVEGCTFKNKIIFTIDSFINDIDTQGSADNRYNFSGVKFNTGHLFALDSFAYALREKIGVPSIKYSFKGIDCDLVSIFEDNNPWFGNNKCHKIIISESLPLTYSMSTTTLDFLIKHKDQTLCSHTLEWLCKKMKLPNMIDKC